MKKAGAIKVGTFKIAAITSNHSATVKYQNSFNYGKLSTNRNFYLQVRCILLYKVKEKKYKFCSGNILSHFYYMNDGVHIRKNKQYKHLFKKELI